MMDNQHEQNSTVEQLSSTRDGGTFAMSSYRQATTLDDALFLESTRIAESEEMLVVDGRANLGPAEQVEHKLSSLLRSCPLPISRFPMTALRGGRRSC